MDSNSLKEEDFKEWYDFELDPIDSELNKFSSINEKYPSYRGVYVFWLKGGEKISYENDSESDIVKIGSSGKRPLACRMWDYLNLSTKKSPNSTSGGSHTVTAWKVRHFISCHKKKLEVAFKRTEKPEEARDEERRLNGLFEGKHGIAPLLEGDLEKYKKWSRRKGVGEETFKSIGGRDWKKEKFPCFSK